MAAAREREGRRRANRQLEVCRMEQWERPNSRKGAAMPRRCCVGVVCSDSRAGEPWRREHGYAQGSSPTPRGCGGRLGGAWKQHWLALSPAPLRAPLLWLLPGTAQQRQARYAGLRRELLCCCLHRLVVHKGAVRGPVSPPRIVCWPYIARRMLRSPTCSGVLCLCTALQQAARLLAPRLSGELRAAYWRPACPACRIQRLASQTAARTLLEQTQPTAAHCPPCSSVRCWLALVSHHSARSAVAPLMASCPAQAPRRG